MTSLTGKFLFLESRSRSAVVGLPMFAVNPLGLIAYNTTQAASLPATHSSLSSTHPFSQIVAYLALPFSIFQSLALSKHCGTSLAKSVRGRPPHSRACFRIRTGKLRATPKLPDATNCISHREDLEPWNTRSTNSLIPTHRMVMPHPIYPMHTTRRRKTLEVQELQ